MSSRSAPFLVDVGDVKRSVNFSEIFQVAFRLIQRRHRLLFAWLVVERVAVGVCDLLVAGAMYVLFLLLQGGSPPHHFWWTPKTTLVAALITAAMIVLRSALDLWATRRVVGYVQTLYKDFLLRLTHGYSEMRWGSFVECNRSELLNHTVNTAREAAIFYHYSIEMTAAVTVVLIMTVALIYQSPAAACGLGAAVLLFYGVHRFLIRERLQRAASEREQAQRMLQRRLADVFASGKEIRTYQNQDFFHGRIREQAGSLGVSSRQVALLPLVARILSDQGVVLLFLGVVVAVQLRHGDVRQLLSLLVFYFVLSRRLLPLISQISLTAGQVESTCENVRIVDSELTKCRLQRTPPRPIQLPAAGFVLELDGVSFAFGEDTPILRDVHLRLRAGESVVLCGVSGSGKSSLLNLMAGVRTRRRGSAGGSKQCRVRAPGDHPSRRFDSE